MHLRLVPLFAWLCLVGSLGLVSPPARADEFRYPKLAPVLGVTLPEGWSVTEQDGPARLLLCSPPDDPTYTISVMSLPTVGNKADLKAILTRITRAGAQGSGMAEITVSDATDGPIGSGPRVFTRVTASGKHNDEGCAYAFYAFSMPGTGKFYAVGVAGLQPMIDAHQAEFEVVALSIRPLR